MWRAPALPLGTCRRSWPKAGAARPDPTRQQRPRTHAGAQGVYGMRKTRPITRRAALRTAAAATVLPLVHIRTAGAAGKLSAGFWDHWVPKGNEAMQKQVD